MNSSDTAAVIGVMILIEVVNLIYFNYIIKGQGKIMATNAELVAAFGELKSTLTDEIEQVNEKLGELANAGTDEERSALLADIRETTTRIKDIIKDAPGGEGEGEGDGEPGGGE